ncbi:uncharacterized protein si:ch211-127m7.2 [Cheilinus undulatus]|uniref:uncharacterized protein si:ch211-127m7.2 n=1 Tax=Cheilinus undulatus TaxID=241271 RepID=UPI001BD2F298|nr:uncharacterized protein si:ch211-127m7.2 [Cheilinus undulatus]
MTDRHRELPSWMSKKEGKVTEKEPLKSRRKRKAARAVFYCMNEKELVVAAVSFLTNAASGDDAPLLSDQKVEGKAKDVSRRIMESPATPKKLTEVLQDESSDCSDAQDMTYVSETDLDITEVETLPYTGNMQHPGPEGQRPEPDQTLTKVEHTQKPADAAEDDDALRLVREIFFT